MINVFFCEQENRWIPSTRKKIGANTKFYKHAVKTFAELFQETLDLLKINFDCCDKQCSYSFVLQHPENVIANYIKEPKLFLIDIFYLNDTSIKTFSHPLDTLSIQGFENVSFPKIYNGIFDDIGYYENYTNLQPPIFMGLIFRDKSDARIRLKMRNKNYEDKRSFRGNNSDLLYRYIELKQIRKLKLYLKTFPDTCHLFDNFKTLYELAVDTIFSFYFLYFVTKEITSLPHHQFHLKKTLFNLHRVYKITKLPITKDYVYVFLLSLSNQVQYKIMKEFLLKGF